MPTFFRDRAALHYEVHGDEGGSHAVFLLHAFPLDGRMWQPQLEALSGRRVVVPDLRGFGKSGAVQPAESIADFALDVAGLLELEERPAVVCGLSMGGYVVFELVRQRPELVGALVLADTRAEADSEDARQGRLRTAEDVLKDGVEGLAGAMPQRLLSEGTRRERPRLTESVGGLISAQRPDGVAGGLRAMASRPDSVGLLPSLDLPVLVIVGSEDGVTPPDASRLMAERIPGARLVEIPGAGHLSNLEQKDAFNAALTDFLAGL
jgi:pimeloyl-ACP methyl ester carboxylesterase